MPENRLLTNREVNKLIKAPLLRAIASDLRAHPNQTISVPMSCMAIKGGDPDLPDALDKLAEDLCA